MSELDITSPYVPVAVHSSNTKVATQIAVDKSSDTPVRTMRVVVPVDAGDFLLVHAEDRLTSPLTYNVGVGIRLQWYDVDDGIAWPHAQPWTQIGQPTGDNVNSDRHHIPVEITRTYKVPSNWPAGHRMVINLMVDAHSTAARTGDYLTVDAYGELIVTRWAPR